MTRHRLEMFPKRHYYSIDCYPSLFILNCVILQSEYTARCISYGSETFSTSDKEFALYHTTRHFTPSVFKNKDETPLQKLKVFYFVFGCNLFVKTGTKEMGIGMCSGCERDGNTLNLRSHRWCTSGTGAGEIRLRLFSSSGVFVNAN